MGSFFLQPLKSQILHSTLKAVSNSRSQFLLSTFTQFLSPDSKRGSIDFILSLYTLKSQFLLRNLACEQFLSPDSKEWFLTQYLEDCLYLLTLKHQFQQTILLYSIPLTLKDTGQILTVRQHDLDLYRFSIYSFLRPRNEFIIKTYKCTYISQSFSYTCQPWKDIHK